MEVNNENKSYYMEKLEKQKVIKTSIVVLSTLVSLSESPDEGLRKPKRFNVDSPS